MSTGPQIRGVPEVATARRPHSIEAWTKGTRHFLIRLYHLVPFIVILPFCAAYVGYWFTIDLSRYYSLYSAVYDLGVEMQSSWIFTQSGSWSGVSTYLAQVGFSPTRFVFSPITIGFDYPALLLFQTVALASGAVAVHAIGRHLLGGHVLPFVFAGTYLIYPPLAGLNWFDFHWEALFVPLFLFGFLFLIRRQYAVSLVLLFLGALTTFPYVILVGLFGIVVGLEAVWPCWIAGAEIDRPKLRFGLVLLVGSAILFLYQMLFLSSFNLHEFLSLVAFTGTAHTNVGGTPPTLTNRLEVILLFLAPLLALPIFSPKWLIMFAPFSALVGISSCW